MSDDVQTPASEEETGRNPRAWANILCLWSLCGNAACRRARACRGLPRVCFRSNFPLLPEDVRMWLYGMAEAREEGKSFEAAMEMVFTPPAGEAFKDWHAAVTVARSGRMRFPAHVQKLLGPDVASPRSSVCSKEWS